MAVLMISTLTPIFSLNKGILVSLFNSGMCLINSLISFFSVQKNNQYTQACALCNDDDNKSSDKLSKQWSAIWASSSLLLNYKHKRFQHQDSSLFVQNAFCSSAYNQQTLTALSFIANVCFISIIRVCRYAILEEAVSSKKMIVPTKHSFSPVAVFFFALNKTTRTQRLIKLCVFITNDTNSCSLK